MALWLMKNISAGIQTVIFSFNISDGILTLQQVSKNQFK